MSSLLHPQLPGGSSSKPCFLDGTRGSASAPSPNFPGCYQSSVSLLPRGPRKLQGAAEPLHTQRPPQPGQSPGLRQPPWQGCCCDKRGLCRQLLISMVTLFLLLFVFGPGHARVCLSPSTLITPLPALHQLGQGFRNVPSLQVLSQRGNRNAQGMGFL